MDRDDDILELVPPVEEEKPRRRKRLLVLLFLLGVAATVAGYTAYALFTGSASENQTISSGTLALTLGTTGTSGNRLNVNATDIAAGDTMQRSFDLSSSGTIDFNGTPTLTTTASTSSLLDTDGTDGLQMTIDRCSVAWTEGGTPPAYTYTCGGTTSTVLASRAIIGSNIALSNLSDLATAGTTARLRLTVTLPTGAGNTFQNRSSTIVYTFIGTQRAGTNK
ncbi:MAG: hypothetical protein FJW96_00185 [Actinobacteria bacterium]|nr:hypothetical protein [Actinomycetota bacterium]